jgi:very-short-patch-repair endonuclease
VVSRSQLRNLGVTDSSIARAVEAGYLHPSFRGVFGVGSARSDPPSRMSAAVLACGIGTVVSHRSAAALLGLQDRAPVVADVIAPGERGRRIDGIRRHHVAPPHGHEIGTCDRIPCTSPSRTIADLAGVLGERRLRTVVERAAVLRLLEPAEIERILSTARRRGAPALRAILGDWQTISSTTQASPENLPHLRSELEARLLALIGRGGLPSPLCNQKLSVQSNRIEVDFLWPRQRVVVEADGKHFHDNSVAFERDRMRDRALHLSGYRVLRFTYSQIEAEPEEVISTIRRLLAKEIG